MDGLRKWIAEKQKPVILASNARGRNTGASMQDEDGFEIGELERVLGNAEHQPAVGG